MSSFCNNKMSASALLILSFAHQAQAYYQRSYISSVNTCYSDTECDSDTAGWTIGFVVFVVICVIVGIICCIVRRKRQEERAEAMQKAAAAGVMGSVPTQKAPARRGSVSPPRPQPKVIVFKANSQECRPVVVAPPVDTV